MLGIEAGAGKSKPLHGTAMDEVFIDDFIDIFEPDEAVPDCLGIDHNGWAVLALVEAAGLVGADEVLEASVLDCVLEGRFELLASLRETAGTGRGFVTLVGADEEMVLKFWHGGTSFFVLFCNGEPCGPRSFLRQYEIDATRQSYLA
jgi:hypothetical protein